jgi:hypothetical protein
VAAQQEPAQALPPVGLIPYLAPSHQRVVAKAQMVLLITLAMVALAAAALLKVRRVSDPVALATLRRFLRRKATTAAMVLVEVEAMALAAAAVHLLRVV